MSLTNRPIGPAEQYAPPSRLALRKQLREQMLREEAARKPSQDNVELTGSGQVHRPESSDRRERG